MSLRHLGPRLTLAVAAALALQPVPVQAQGGASAFIGTWRLNLAQSKPVEGEPPPASLVTRIERMDPAHVRWTTTTTDARGQTDVTTFDNPGNGEFYSLDGDTMVSHRLSPTAVQSTYRDQSGQTDVLSCALAGNDRQMTCNGAITRPDGSTARYTDVFDRQ